MEKKKINNPKIVDGKAEDVRVFNAPTITDSLEKKVGNVTVVKTDVAHGKEIEQLIRNYYSNIVPDSELHTITGKVHNCNTITFELDTGLMRGKARAVFIEPDINVDGEKTFVKNGECSPLKLYVYDSRFLESSKEFAKSYQELTEQKVTIIQECADVNKVFKKPINLKEDSARSQFRTNMGLAAFDMGVVGLNVGIGISNLIESNYFVSLLNFAGAVFVGYLGYRNGKDVLKAYDKLLEENYGRKK